jgi:hypothetical protein
MTAELNSSSICNLPLSTICYVYMKIFITTLIILVLIGIGGYLGFRSLSKSTGNTGSVLSQIVKLTGTVQTGKGDDYSYVLMTPGKIVGLASQTVKLGDYTNQKVEVTGQYSGTTLYVDSITAAP